MLDNLYKLFKAYDLRGDAQYLSAEVYYLIGKAFVEKILIPQNLPLKAVVSHDGRLTSPGFYKGLCNGLVDAGCKIIPLGLSATEIMYQGAITNQCSGLIVTASHNPGKDNGLKIVKSIPQMLGLDSGLSEIRDYVISHLEDGFKLNELNDISIDEENKSIIIQNWLESYKEIGELEKINKKGESKKIVVDTGNGMGGFLMGFLKDLYTNIEFIPLYWEIDGNFPNHDADPMVESNLSDLKKKVIEENADLGVAFDGDGDRAFFVDQKGDLINNEFCCAIFAKHMCDYMDKNPQSKLSKSIVYVTSYSMSTPNAIIAGGAAAVPCRQGHTFVKSKMKEYNACYGAEASGHHYYGQFGYMDSGAITMGLMINILDSFDGMSSELTSFWKKYHFLSGELNRKLPEGLDINQIRSLIKSKYKDGQFWEEDGITVYYPDWKVTVRTSNTEPLARINIETIGQNNVEATKKDIFELLGIKDV